jgi:4'-phosphopantetheinyl transferase
MGWRRPESPPGLGPDDVHVWRLDLDAMIPAGLALTSDLAEEERDRAARFRFARDRERYLAGRVALRGILAGYLGRPPETLRFVRAPFGKPALFAEPTGLQFNLTHSDWCALVAVARGRRVGVDVEGIRLGQSSMDVARRFFARGEVDALVVAAPEERAVTFVRCWTRKEAYVKARGDGLSLSLQHFEVPLSSDAAWALASSEEDPSEVGRWSLHELLPAPCYLGALVVEGASYRLSTWEWAPMEAAAGTAP